MGNYELKLEQLSNDEWLGECDSVRSTCIV